MIDEGCTIMVREEFIPDHAALIRRALSVLHGEAASLLNDPRSVELLMWSAD